MRILALITARGGSKRLPNKNIKILGDKPLIVWSINVVKNIPEIVDILVSTDDSAIATIAKSAGAFVPWLRPAELATDRATSIDVVLHALKWYETEKGVVDGVLLLQPTSPFRTRASVLHGIDLFRMHNFKSVLGVSLTHSHPMWTLKIEGDYLVPFMKNHGLGTCSQELPPAYVVNGSFYLNSPRDLVEGRSFIGPETIPLLIESQQEALDIDSEWDWKMAELIASSKSESN